MMIWGGAPVAPPLLLDDRRYIEQCRFTDLLKRVQWQMEVVNELS